MTTDRTAAHECGYAWCVAHRCTCLHAYRDPHPVAAFPHRARVAVTKTTRLSGELGRRM